MAEQGRLDTITDAGIIAGMAREPEADEEGTRARGSICGSTTQIPKGSSEHRWRGIPATGRRVSLTGVDVFKLADGRIVEEQIHGDYQGFLRQLGAMS